MRILISNDDGINSEGINVLEKAAKHISNDVWVVAPELDKSAVSRAITIRKPIKVDKIDNRKFVVGGTPTDCLLLALHSLMSDKAPDIILSGVNIGSNLATDIGYSGTAGVAIGGVMHGINSIAFSQYYDGEHNIEWNRVLDSVVDVLDVLKDYFVEKQNPVALNVNLPNNPIGIKITKHSSMLPTIIVQKDENNDYWLKGGATAALRAYKNITDPLTSDRKFCLTSLEGLIQEFLEKNPDFTIAEESDLPVVASGYISINPIGLHFDNHNEFNQLLDYFSKK